MNQLALLAQAPSIATIGWWAIAAVAVITIVAIVLALCRANNVAVPPFVVNVAWILLCFVLAVLAIMFVVWFAVRGWGGGP